MAEIIESPDAYYNELRSQMSRVQHRAIFSALYIGVDKLELALIQDIEQALNDPTRPLLTVTLILDHSRALRKDGGSVEILSSLASKYFPRFQVFYYRMPSSSGFISNQLPIILREVLGVYHVKFNVFDDCAILTGANLSKEYFITRLDRYIKLDCRRGSERAVLEYLENFTESIKDFCYSLRSNQLLLTPKLLDSTLLAKKIESLSITYRTSKQEYSKALDVCLNQLLNEPPNSADTIYYPVVQHSTIGVNQERVALFELLQSVDKSRALNMFISSPYPSFTTNLIDAIASTLKSHSQNVLTVIKAGRISHGFANGKGSKALVPDMHDEYLHSILKRFKQNLNRVNVLSYNRPGWTFHTKGLWLTRDSIAGDSNFRIPVTYIGSSNFGQRSWGRDFELGFIVLTNDIKLQRKFGDEIKGLIESHTSKSDLHKHSYKHSWTKRYMVNVFTRAIKSFL